MSKSTKPTSSTTRGKSRSQVSETPTVARGGGQAAEHQPEGNQGAEVNMENTKLSDMEFMMAMLRGAIEPIFPPRMEELGLSLIDAEDNPRDLIESLCGIDNSQDVEQYDGTLGVTVGFVAVHQRPVGQVQWNDNLASRYTNPGNVSGVRWCSGTLISNDLFLTAGHCFDQSPNGWVVPRVNGTMNPISSAEIASNMRVNFDYQFDPSGTLRPAQSFAVTELVEYRLNGLDFAIARLAGNPGTIFGTTVVAQQDANQGNMICIIQHPAGLPKRIEAGPLSELVGNFVRYNDIDTLGGTSGAGILGPNGTILGVHTNGGCTGQMTGHNFGVRISAIRNASPTVRNLRSKIGPADLPKPRFVDDPRFVPPIIPKLKLLDDPKRKLFDDPNFKKIIDDPKRKFFDDPIDPFTRPPFDPNPILGREGNGGEAAPFILATPHHAVTGGETAASSGAGQGGQSYQLQSRLSQLEQALQQAAQEYAQLQTLYHATVAEMQSLGGDADTQGAD